MMIYPVYNLSVSVKQCYISFKVVRIILFVQIGLLQIILWEILFQFSCETCFFPYHCLLIPLTDRGKQVHIVPPLTCDVSVFHWRINVKD